MESYKSKFTLSQRRSFMEKKNPFPTLLLMLIKEITHIHTKSKTFLFITQIPVRTYMENEQTNPRRKGHEGPEQCETETLCDRP